MWPMRLKGSWHTNPEGPLHDGIVTSWDSITKIWWRQWASFGFYEYSMLLTVVLLIGDSEFRYITIMEQRGFSQQLEYGICEQGKLKRTLRFASRATCIVHWNWGSEKQSFVGQCWCLRKILKSRSKWKKWHK